MPGDEEKPLRERLRELRAERGLSRSQLSRKTVEIDGKGLPEITIKILETSSTNQPRIDTMRVLAQALGVGPEVFLEYQLAVARATLDEREVGLDEAVRMLRQIEKAMRPRQSASRLEAERSQATDDQRREGRPARRSRQAG